MNGLFATRNMFVGLALVAGVLAVFLAWLLSSGRVEAPSLFAAREKPAANTEKPAANTEKPAAPAGQQQSAVNSATETLKGLTDQLATTPKPDAAKPATDALTPTFDIARIAPNGEAVIAGRAAPGASVELLQDGKVHDRTIADASGAFVFVPQPLPSGHYDLTLRATGKDGQPARSSAPVVVTLDARAADKAVTASVTPPALTAKPGDALKLGDALKPNDPRTGAAASVQIDAVTAGEGGKLRVLGRATPGAVVKLHLNDAYIASATAAPDGRVDFSILDGVKPGEYRVRLDQTGSTGNVVARIERMFEAPVALASPSSAPQQDAAATKQETPSQLATGSTDQANVVVVPKIDTKVVLRGDNLWRISQATYGHGKSYTRIYSANRNQIRNPNLIFPDQIFVLPSAAE